MEPVLIAIVIYLQLLFTTSERASVWYGFYKDVGELYWEVAEKPLSATVQLPLFLLGLVVLGIHLGHQLRKFEPLV